MRRIGLMCLAVSVFACAKPPQEVVEDQAKPGEQAKPSEPPEWQPKRAKPTIVRTDLVAQELPLAPQLELLELQAEREGSFDFPEGTDELAPRAAVALREGVALVGQVYLRRRPGRPPATWRWVGVVPDKGEASGTKLEEGSIRAAIVDGKGGALLAGSLGTGFDLRGWYGTLDSAGALASQVDLDSPMTTEMFDLLAGQRDEEQALVLGYVDAQGWAVSLDAQGTQRWQKFVSSFGYTQIRAGARVPGEAGNLLVVGSRGKDFSESWWAMLPGDGGKDASGEDVEQGALTIQGADKHQLLRCIVDLGEAGFVALGTAKLNHIQAHDQLIAAGFDPSGTPTWSRVIPSLRVQDIHAGAAKPGAPGVAQFVLTVPVAGGPDEDESVLALLELDPGPEGEAQARELADSRRWASAGLIEGAATPTLVAYRPTKTGAMWRFVALP